MRRGLICSNLQPQLKGNPPKASGGTNLRILSTRLLKRNESYAPKTSLLQTLFRITFTLNTSDPYYSVFIRFPHLLYSLPLVNLTFIPFRSGIFLFLLVDPNIELALRHVQSCLDSTVRSTPYCRTYHSRGRHYHCGSRRPCLFRAREAGAVESSTEKKHRVVLRYTMWVVGACKMIVVSDIVGFYTLIFIYGCLHLIHSSVTSKRSVSSELGLP
ncbi:unnamed protein product [Protopolystoma xenopodis]|uniref:Transmembrane protein n=1 Tax=Protopolystoma xenopodis TaxID=117903 RepID=A0A3S5AAT1_9PLAT|nr:unnamed protein product [Protopolystoma xenopodis]